VKAVVDVFDLPDDARSSIALNAERSQYQAAVRVQAVLSDLEQKQNDRLELRGKLLVWQPMIESALAQWQQHFEGRQQELQERLSQFDSEMQRLHEQDIRLAREQAAHEQEQTGLWKECERLAGLQQRFALVPEQAVLEARRQEFLTERDALIVRIGQAQSREPKAIRGELQRLEQELLLLEQEMRTQCSNLYQQLASHLSPSQLSALNKVLAKPVLTLGADDFALDALTRAVGAFAQARPEVSTRSGRMAAQRPPGPSRCSAARRCRKAASGSA
jgi:predicted nuclease with TOPRIM domain